MVKDWPWANRERRSSRAVDADEFEQGLVNRQRFTEGFANLWRTTPTLAAATRVLHQFTHAAHTATNGLPDG